MTNEEAFEIMQNISNDIENEYGGYPYTEEEELKLIAMDKAISALEKQMPKRVHKNYDGLSARWCECGGYVATPIHGYKYCPYCGQAIDWSGKE